MASISNTGKTVTIAFSVEEKAELEQVGGEAWLWQIPEFSLNENQQGVLTLRPDMFKGRKLQKMTKNGETPERWMLVIPSGVMPHVPYFTKVTAETRFDESVFVATLPRELPALSERKAKIAALTAKPNPAPKAKAAPIAKAEPAKPTQAVAVIPQPQQRHGSNMTMLIEGKSFRYDIPLEARIRLITELAQFATSS